MTNIQQVCYGDPCQGRGRCSLVNDTYHCQGKGWFAIAVDIAVALVFDNVADVVVAVFVVDDEYVIVVAVDDVVVVLVVLVVVLVATLVVAAIVVLLLIMLFLLLLLGWLV